MSTSDVFADQSTTIPERAFNGRWWTVPAMVEVECPRCGAITSDQPHVMRYVESYDWGGGCARLEPLWAARGWRVWWACRACGREWFKYHDNNYATTETIEEWVADFRSWYRSLKWERAVESVAQEMRP